MSRRRESDGIRVAEPCSENWDEMIGNERVKFCSHCAKNVTNLSTITREQAERFVKRSGGNICIRYFTDPQSGVPLYAGDLVRIARRAPKFAAGVVSATLSLAAMAMAQEPSDDVSEMVVDEQQISAAVDPAAGRSAEDKKAAMMISGVLRRADGQAVHGVSVTLADKTNRWGYATSVTNTRGEFKFKDLDEGTYYIRIEDTGGRMRKAAPAIEISTSGQPFVKDIYVSVVEDRIQVTGSVGEGLGSGQSIVTAGAMAPMPRLSLAPLDSAIFSGDIKAAEKALRQGASADGPADAELSSRPLAKAIRAGNVAMVRLLLNYGAKADRRSEDKETYLMRLDSSATPELVRLLISHGADPKAVSEYGDTALINAVQNTSVDVVKAFIDLGADVNEFADDDEKETLLMAAVDRGESEIVKLLVDNGADVLPVDKKGETAWDKTNDLEIETILVDAGARPKYDISVRETVYINEKGERVYPNDDEPEENALEASDESVEALTDRPKR